MAWKCARQVLRGRGPPKSLFGAGFAGRSTSRCSGDFLVTRSVRRGVVSTGKASAGPEGLPGVCGRTLSCIMAICLSTQSAKG